MKTNMPETIVNEAQQVCTGDPREWPAGLYASVDAGGAFKGSTVRILVTGNPWSRIALYYPTHKSEPEYITSLSLRYRRVPGFTGRIATLELETE